MKLLGVFLVALAHTPIDNTGDHSSADTAIFVEDITLSQVIYHEVTAERPSIWLEFNAAAGEELFFQLGVPVIAELSDYGPSLALIGPGLPDDEVPFPLPDQSTAQVFPTEGVSPEYFAERFTGTDSWIYIEETVSLAEAGTYYLVGYHPDNTPGKLWVAVGREERFAFADILALPDVIDEVRAFHEVADEPPPVLTRFLIAIARFLASVFSIF